MPRGRSVNIATGSGHRSKVTLAKLARKVNKNARVLGNREIKRIRFTFGDTTPSTTSVVQNLTGIGQGDAPNQRTGSKIHLKHVSVSGSIVKNTSFPFTKIRMIIFRDNLGGTTPPVIGDIFSSEDDFHDNEHRQPEEQPMARFTVLWDKYIILNEGFDGQTTAAAFKFSKRLNSTVLFSGSASTNEGKNSLWLMSASDEATNTPSLTADIVVKYSDL